MTLVSFNISRQIMLSSLLKVYSGGPILFDISVQFIFPKLPLVQVTEELINSATIAVTNMILWSLNISITHAFA